MTGKPICEMLARLAEKGLDIPEGGLCHPRALRFGFLPPVSHDCIHCGVPDYHRDDFALNVLGYRGSLSPPRPIYPFDSPFPYVEVDLLDPNLPGFRRPDAVSTTYVGSFQIRNGQVFLVCFDRPDNPHSRPSEVSCRSLASVLE